MRSDLSDLNMGAKNLLGQLSSAGDIIDADSLLEQFIHTLDELITLSEKKEIDACLRERLTRFLNVLPHENTKRDIDRFKETLSGRLQSQEPIDEISKPYELFVSLVDNPNADLPSEEYDIINGLRG